MARILFTTHPGTGHFNPLAPLAAALQAAGHDVRVGAASGFGAEIAAAGLRAVPLGLDWAENRVERTFPGFLALDGASQLRILAGAPASALAADLIALARTWRPDLIVRDSAEFGGWVAAEELGVPSVVYGVLARLPSAVSGGVIGPELAALRAARSLPADPTLSTLPGRLFLDTAPPSLDFAPAAPGEPRVARIRPVFADARGGAPLPAWLADQQSSRRPTVFATLGTVFNREPSSLQRIIDAVTDEAYEVLLALGDAPPPSGTVPKNVHVEGYVPLSRVLPACAAVLSHGGRGTVLTALSQGIPVCSIPVGADQPITAGLVERAGAGVSCATGAFWVGALTCPSADPARLDPLTIRRQLRRLFDDPAFAERARVVQAEIARLPGPEDVVPLITCLLAATACGMSPA